MDGLAFRSLGIGDIVKVGHHMSKLNINQFFLSRIPLEWDLWLENSSGSVHPPCSSHPRNAASMVYASEEHANLEVIWYSSMHKCIVTYCHLQPEMLMGLEFGELHSSFSPVTWQIPYLMGYSFIRTIHSRNTHSVENQKINNPQFHEFTITLIG